MGDPGVQATSLGQPIRVAAGLRFQKLTKGKHGVGATSRSGLAEARLGGGGVRRTAALAAGQHLAKGQGRIVAGPGCVRSTVIGGRGGPLQPGQGLIGVGPAVFVGRFPGSLTIEGAQPLHGRRLAGYGPRRRLGVKPFGQAQALSRRVRAMQAPAAGG